MDVVLQFIDPYLRLVLAWWSSLGPGGVYYVWIAAGILGLMLWAFVSYQLVRRLLGHQKVFGVWFRPGELDPLLDRLEEIAKNGTILQARDMAILDIHRPGWRPHLKRFGEGDFVGW
jgi:hypothetical protein